MNMFARVMKKDNPKKFWLIMFRLIAGGLFFFSLFLHFYNIGFFGAINAFTWPGVDWLYIFVFFGIIVLYYVLEFTNDKFANATFKLHTILAMIHFTSMIYVVIDSSATIRLWAFVQLLFIALMFILAWFPNLIMNLFFKVLDKPKKEKKPKKDKNEKHNDDDIQDAEYVEIIDPVEEK